MKTAWSLKEWLETRNERRRVSDKISPNECGRADSREDRQLRAAFGGRRNLVFAEEFSKVKRGF